MIDGFDIFHQFQYIFHMVNGWKDKSLSFFACVSMFLCIFCSVFAASALTEKKKRKEKVLLLSFKFPPPTFFFAKGQKVFGKGIIISQALCPLNFAFFLLNRLSLSLLEIFSGVNFGYLCPPFCLELSSIFLFPLEKKFKGEKAVHSLPLFY